MGIAIKSPEPSFNSMELKFCDCRASSGCTRIFISTLHQFQFIVEVHGRLQDRGFRHTFKQSSPGIVELRSGKTFEFLVFWVSQLEPVVKLLQLKFVAIFTDSFCKSARWKQKCCNKDTYDELAALEAVEYHGGSPKSTVRASNRV